jgi:hypothetical protein
MLWKLMTILNSPLTHLFWQPQVEPSFCSVTFYTFERRDLLCTVSQSCATVSLTHYLWCEIWNSHGCQDLSSPVFTVPRPRRPQLKSVSAYHMTEKCLSLSLSRRTTGHYRIFSPFEESSTNFYDPSPEIMVMVTVTVKVKCKGKF